MDVNDTDEEESKNSIVNEPFHKPPSENLSMDLNEPECNIINEIDVPTNVITELKYDEHIEPSVTDKGSSYFNIFKCGGNLLDQLYVTYQHAFTASSEPSTVPKGYYQLSPARERFYDIISDQIVERMTELTK